MSGAYSGPLSVLIFVCIIVQILFIRKRKGCRGNEPTKRQNKSDTAERLRRIISFVLSELLFEFLF